MQNSRKDSTQTPRIDEMDRNNGTTTTAESGTVSRPLRSADFSTERFKRALKTAIFLHPPWGVFTPPHLDRHPPNVDTPEGGVVHPLHFSGIAVL